jgi:hypothetical protein
MSAGMPSSSVLASIFVLSMLLMCLVPYTLCVWHRARVHACAAVPRLGR